VRKIEIRYADFDRAKGVRSSMFQAWNMEDLTPRGNRVAAAPPISLL
jgi:hypothetical protein